MEGTLKVSQENRCFLITPCGESRNFFRCPAAPKATQNMRVLNSGQGHGSSCEQRPGGDHRTAQRAVLRSKDAGVACSPPHRAVQHSVSGVPQRAAARPRHPPVPGRGRLRHRCPAVPQRSGREQGDIIVNAHAARDAASFRVRASRPEARCRGAVPAAGRRSAWTSRHSDDHRDTVHVTLGQLPAADRDRRVRRAVAMADLHPASIAGTQQILHTRLSKRHGLRRRPPAHIEVIAMTISRRPRLAGSGSPVRRALSSSVRACGICTTSRFTRGSALAVLPCAATLDAGSCRGAAAGSGAPPRSARRTGRPIPAAPLPTSHRHIGQLQPGRPADPRSQWAGPVLPDSSPPPGSRPDRQADQPIGFYELVC